MDDQSKRILIQDIKFTLRTENALKYHGIKYIDQLSEISYKQLHTWQNLGKKSIKEIRDQLLANGITLKDEIIYSVEEGKNILRGIPEYLKDVQNELKKFQEEFRILSFKIENICLNMKKKTHDH